MPLARQEQPIPRANRTQKKGHGTAGQDVSTIIAYGERKGRGSTLAAFEQERENEPRAVVLERSTSS